MSGLKKRFKKVGFIKPVGQEHVTVKPKNGFPLKVDKDVKLMKEVSLVPLKLISAQHLMRSSIVV